MKITYFVTREHAARRAAENCCRNGMKGQFFPTRAKAESYAARLDRRFGGGALIFALKARVTKASDWLEFNIEET